VREHDIERDQNTRILDANCTNYHRFHWRQFAEIISFLLRACVLKFYDSCFRFDPTPKAKSNALTHAGKAACQPTFSGHHFLPAVLPDPKQKLARPFTHRSPKFLLLG
jgi:hypothetical protein